jgi:metal-responsive CopG/Arc/MetJ family transcriptional regulator
MKPAIQTARVNLTIPPGLKRRLDAASKRAELCRNEFIRRAIEAALTKTTKGQ